MNVVNGSNPCKKCGETKHQFGICSYPSRLRGLILIRSVMKVFDKQFIAHCLVEHLHAHDSLYHFDDRPYEIIDAKTGELLFKDPAEITILMDIVMYCYCGELFSYACKKIGI